MEVLFRISESGLYYNINLNLRGRDIMIPEKKSKNWLIIFIFYMLIVFLALLVTRLLIGHGVVTGGIQGILVLSLCSALIPCIGGYFGKQIFFIFFSISVVIGILYAFYSIIANIAPGWGDLTSLFGYVFIIAIGLIVALNAELILLYNKNKRK